MKLIKKIDDNTRIKLKFYVCAFESVFCLQRRKWYGWITVSWIYPSMVTGYTLERLIEWLEWNEEDLKAVNKSERQIGKKLFTKFEEKK